LTPVTFCHLPNLSSLPMATTDHLPLFVNTSPFIKPLTGILNNGNNDLKLFVHLQNLIVSLLLCDTILSEFGKAKIPSWVGWLVVSILILCAF